LKIIFIGTGSGKTSLNRNHSSLLISIPKYNLLVDTGDGISKALLALGIDFNSINGVLITHLHADHYSGLASLITQMKMSKRKDRLDIFIHPDVVDVIKNFIYQSYLFEERLNFDLNFISLAVNIFTNVSEKFKIQFRQNSHLNEYEEYDHQRELKFPCGSFLFKINSKNIFYTGDVGSENDLYLFKDFKLSVAISEATHIEIKEIVKFYNFAKPGKLFLTHITDEEIFNDLIPPGLIDKIKFAYDGLEIDL